MQLVVRGIGTIDGVGVAIDIEADPDLVLDALGRLDLAAVSRVGHVIHAHSARGECWRAEEPGVPYEPSWRELVARHSEGG